MQICRSWTEQAATASQTTTSMLCPTACTPQLVFRHSHLPSLRTRYAAHCMYPPKVLTARIHHVALRGFSDDMRFYSIWLRCIDLQSSRMVSCQG